MENSVRIHLKKIGIIAMCLCMLVTMMPINMFSYAQEEEKQPEIKIKDAKGVDLELYQLLSYDEAGELKFGADYSPEGETAPADLEAQIQSIVGTKNVGVDDARIVEILERIGSETGINPSSEHEGDVIYSAIPEGWYILTSSNKDIGLLLEYRNEDIEVSALSIVEWIEAQETAKDVEPEAETKEEPTETIEEKTSEEKEAEPEMKEDSQKEKKKTSVKKAAANDATKSNSLEFNEEDIEKFTAEFVRGADIQRDGSLMWNPQNSNADHRFVYKVTYAFSGVGEIAARDVEIRVPKRVIKDRDGNYADYYDIAIPSEAEYAREPDPDTKWVFKEDPDNENELIIYNVEEISAAEAGTIEVSYLTTKRTFYYTDMSSTDDFYANLVVKNENTEVTAEASAPPIVFNTYANIVSVTKQNPRLYKHWDSSFGEEPEDAEDYYYLVWTLRTALNQYATQPYNLIYDDTFDDGEVVGFKFEGSKTFTPENVKNNIYQTSKERFDYVLTRHPKAEFIGRNYTVWNRVTATVDPYDNIDEDTSANSKAPFKYELPVYQRPPGHFYAEKFGQYLSTYSTATTEYGDGSLGIVRDSEDISDFSLTEFKEGSVDKIDNVRLKYYAFLRGYAYPWTIDEGDSLDDPTSFGKNPVTYEFTDENLCIGKNEDLGPGDYEINKLRITYALSSAQFDEEELYFREISVNKSTLTADNDIFVYAKRADDSDWVAVGRYSIVNNEFYDLNNEYVDHVDGHDIFFKEGILGYKWTTSNALYYTRVNSYPNITLFRTDKVLSDIGDARKISLKNTAFVKVTDYKGNEIFPSDARNAWGELFSEAGVHNIDYIAGVIRESYIQKKQTGAIPNKAKRNYTVSWHIDMNESYEDNEGKHYKQQESGKFYDLCPLGSHADPKSIEVFKNGYTRLAKNEYDVEIISNYKKTGRDMVIIGIKVPASRYSFNIDTVHEWEDLKDTTFDILNPVAYETGNENIAEGYPDNGGDSKEKALMTDLDPDTDAVKFIYSEDKHHIDLVTSTSTGLNKKVRARTDSKYSYSTFTTINGEYYYRIRLQNDTATKTKGIIFYDSLENYANEHGVSTDWHGTLQDVDVSTLKNIGIDPVVYYSSIENLDIYAHHDLTETIDGEKVWKTEEEFGDILNAKAIAIDCQKMTNGEDYVLNSGDSIQARLIMKAPPRDENIGRIRYAYNNVFMRQIEVNEHEEEHEDLIRHDYTQIGLKISGTTDFLKVEGENHEAPIGGIKFLLSGVSAYGTNVEEELISGSDGKVILPELEMGEYELRELESSDDWIVDREVHHVTIDGVGNATIDLDKEGDAYIWENFPRVHGDVTLRKESIDTVEGRAVIPGTEFTLSGTSEYGTNVFVTGVTDANGNLSFKNLEQGTYSLIETKENPDYLPNDTVYTVIIDENGLGQIKNCEAQSNSYIIENKPRYHAFDIRKVDSENEEMRLEGAEFLLTGVSNIGTVYDGVKATTNSRGIASFVNIEAGTYSLKETKAPDKHVLDPTTYTVIISDSGEVTIDGLDSEDGKIFKWKNDRTLDGKIKITKMWEDGLTNDERPIPKVHIMTAESYYNDTEAFAEYDTNTGTLRIFRDRRNKYYGGQQIGSKIYYMGLEDGSSGWNSDNRVSAINKVVIEDVIRPRSIHSWFSGNKMKFSKIDLSNIDTSALTDMGEAFRNNTKISSVEFGDHFDTSHVTNMGYMFSKCTNLRSIDMTGMDVRGVTNTYYMFEDCTSLREANLHGLAFRSASSSCEYMFRNCKNLQRVDLSNAILPDMYGFFYDCTSLEKVDASEAELSGLQTTFTHCDSLRRLNLKDAKVKGYIRATFSASSGKSIGTVDDPLRINTQGCDFSEVWNMSYMFGSSSVVMDSLYMKDLGIHSQYGYMTAYDSFDGLELTKPNAPVVLDGVNLNNSSGSMRYDLVDAGAGDNRNEITFIIANTALKGSDMYLDVNDSVVFSNVEVQTTSLSNMGSRFRGTLLDFRGLKHTERLQGLPYGVYSIEYYDSSTNSNHRPITNRDRQLVILGDDFDMSNVTDFNHFGDYCGTDTSDHANYSVVLPTEIYLGHDNFKLLSENHDYRDMFENCASSDLPLTIYSDVDESPTTVPQNSYGIFSWSDIVGSNGTALTNNNMENNGYRYWKVDGGADSPGVFTPTSEANLPDHPDVVYERAMDACRAEAEMYFSDGPMFSYKQPMKALSSNVVTSEDDTLGLKVTINTSQLAGSCYLYWEQDDALKYIYVDNSDGEKTYYIKADDFYISYGQQGPVDTDITVTSIEPITEEVEYSSCSSVDFNQSNGYTVVAAASETINYSMLGSSYTLVENKNARTAEQMHITENTPYRTHIAHYIGDGDADDMMTEDDKWVKDGNTWTYTFNVYDDEILYYMYEDPLEGYASIYSGPINGNDVITKSGTIINRNTNTGNILLKKNIENGISSDADREFEFKIKLHANDPSLTAGVQTYGDTMFVNGEATVKLSSANTEGIFLTDIPEYYTYTIEEVSHPSFETTTIQVDDETIDGRIVSGDITKDETISVTYTNTRTKESNSSFKVKKKIEGVSDDKTEFSFTAQINGLEANDRYAYKVNGTQHSYTANNLGIATVTFKLKHNQECEFEELPRNATYMVTESANKYIPSYKVMSEEDVESSGSMPQAMSDLSTGIEQVDTTAVFTNTPVPDDEEETEIKFVKKANDTAEFLPGAVYRLSGISDAGDEIDILKTSDSNGEFSFKHITNGEYTLKEETAPDGFTIDPTVRRVKIVNGHPIHYATDEVIDVVYSHTSNMGDNGVATGFPYYYSENRARTVTIDGASMLKIDVWCATGSTYDAWLAIYGADQTPASNNYGTAAISQGRLGGGATYNSYSKPTDEKCHKVYWVDGDTAKFYFWIRSSSYSYYNGYGYYATVTGVTGRDYEDYDMHELSVEGVDQNDKGQFVLTDTREKLGEFELQKVSSVNHDQTLRGAEFTLYDDSNKVVSRQMSDTRGTMKFANLTPGSYTLKETDAPTGYVKSDKVYTVTVDAESNVTISDPTGSALEPIDGKYQIENTPQPVDLNIKKTVVGAMGDKNKDFNFIVHVEKTLPGDYVIEKSGGESETITVGSNGIADIPVSVKHNQTATIKGLSYNAEVVVTEPSSEYFAGYTVTTGTRVINSRSNQAANTELSTQEIILDGDYTVEYMNSLDGVVPTGMEQTKKNLMILFFALSIVFVAILRKIRKDASAK